jgi:predicted protein tyrosine phosphatase
MHCYVFLLQSILEGSVGGSRDDELSMVQHMQIALVDMETSDILSHLPACVTFIDDAIKSGGRVLVHCMAGVSRSVSVMPESKHQKCYYRTPGDPGRQFAHLS